MHIQLPADILSKEVYQELKFHFGDRQASSFTKSTEHGTITENNHNNYLRQEEQTRALRSSFIEQYNIGSDIGEERGNADVFHDAVEDPELNPRHINAARQEIDRIDMTREDQRSLARGQILKGAEKELHMYNELDKRLRETVAEEASARRHKEAFN